MMSRKVLISTLAIAGIGLLSLPALAGAQGIDIDGVTTVSGSAGASSLEAPEEARLTCESGDVSGEFVNPTTVNMTLDFTGCHITIFGLTTKCRTAGSMIDNTISVFAVGHAVTISSGVPGLMLTFNITTFVCAGVPSMVMRGNAIGTITQPKCETSSETATIAFSAAGAAQEHSTYTGVSYSPVFDTDKGGGANGGLKMTVNIASSTNMTLTCL